MHQIRLREITIEKIKSKELEEIIPELYELRDIIENNRSHINDSVFNHTISILTELEKLFGRINKEINNYLIQKVDYHTRKELLFFAAVFHDIGKKETLQKDGSITKCPGHEIMSARKFKQIMPKFVLSDDEKEIIVQIIANHGFFHDALDCPEENLDKKVTEFQKANPNIFLEVVLLTIADIFSGQLKENNPEGFNFKIDFLNKVLGCFK